jgi:hypothetical protein
MEDTVARLQENEDVDVEQLEVWNDQENAEQKAELDQDQDGDELCGGVPFFYNTATDEWICGETSYDELVAWATGDSL